MKRIPLEIKNLCTVFTLVDDEDYEKIKHLHWKVLYRNSNFYVYARDYKGSGKDIMLHRLIMNPVHPLVVDHINGDGLDNRKENLRICTRQQNSANVRNTNTKTKKSKYRGVHDAKNSGKKNPWKVTISINGRTTYIGAYPTEEQAARVYNQKALELYGEFAVLNIIEEKK